jgi:O-antigen/teichoic acid export membrane protein
MPWSLSDAVGTDVQGDHRHPEPGRRGMTPRHPIPHQAIVRPDHRGRTHPDPREDPPTQAFDPANAPTVRLPAAVADTVRIPTVHNGGRIARPEVPPETDTGLHDGLSLSISSLIGSAAGFISWLIAARIMPTADVGNAQLVVSAFMLVGGAAQLNLGVGLMRWVPAAGKGTSRLVWGSLLLMMPLSAVIGLVYAVITPRLASISAGVGGSFVFGLLVFGLACAGWVVFVVHDMLLVSLGKPWWSVWRNALFVAARIGLLVVLCAVLPLGEFGVVVSWVGPIVVWIAVGTVVIGVLVRKASANATADGVPSRAEMLAFLGPTAVSQAAISLLYNQIPVLVNVRFGPETGIVFFIAWQAVMVIDLAAVFFMDSLSVSAGREPHRIAELAAAARRRLLIIFLPALALGAALADPLLAIFGPAYAEADNVLRLLLLGLAFRLVVAHELGVRQAIGWGMGFARLQLISSILVLLVAIVVPVTGGGVSALMPVAIGYVVAQVASAAAVLLFPAVRRRADLEVRSP